MRSVDTPGRGEGRYGGWAGRRWVRRSTLIMLGVAGIVAGAVSVRMWALQRAALDEVATLVPEQGVVATDTARVLGSNRTLKLVTVELATHVNAESVDESWRGDVHAKVDAPVKLQRVSATIEASWP